ncbi:hypothetical protein CBR_g30617 [Chara braunii]|uniref:VWFA domain-containing protein n=1 Tax=Chara braunii TaxID=69332 RepID=A0A388LD55_CHABU|nr:hypothetical protein CBR_g30617 [Chara braunii]|eukprot:GBG80251.1 hypothetical protein CBR_g30617 [Chara braunii]
MAYTRLKGFAVVRLRVMTMLIAFLVSQSSSPLAMAAPGFTSPGSPSSGLPSSSSGPSSDLSSSPTEASSDVPSSSVTSSSEPSPSSTGSSSAPPSNSSAAASELPWSSSTPSPSSSTPSSQPMTLTISSVSPAITTSSVSTPAVQSEAAQYTPPLIMTAIPDPKSAGNRANFIRALTERVEAVAYAARLLYSRPCEAIDSCKGGKGEHSRLACGYISKYDKEYVPYQCVTGVQLNTSLCCNGTNATENTGSILISLTEPFMRYPEVVGRLSSPEAQGTLHQHACIQSSLKKPLKDAISTEADFIATGWVSFASIAGTFYSFPGLNVFDGFGGTGFPFDCDPYDPRFRPWFQQISGPQKKVSILVQGASMMWEPLKNNPLETQTGLDALKQLLVVLKKTFAEHDRIFLTTEVSEGNINRTGSFMSSDFSSTSVTRMQPDKSSPPGDLAEGVRLALSQLADPSRYHLEVLLVFTRGPINVEGAASVIAEHNKRSLSITGRPVSVFIYGVDVYDSTTFANMTRLAELVNGTARNMGLGDPLLGIYSYFDFMARSFHNHPPTWARLYTDAFSQAEITTLMKHVFDLQGRSIGIVGLDVKVPALAKEIAGNMSMDPPPITVSNPRDTLQLPTCTSPCEDGYPGISCPGDVQLEATDVLFPKVMTADAEKRRCCGATCLSSGKLSKLSARENFVLQVAVAAVLIIALLSQPGHPIISFSLL